MELSYLNTVQYTGGFSGIRPAKTVNTNPAGASSAESSPCAYVEPGILSKAKLGLHQIFNKDDAAPDYSNMATVAKINSLEEEFSKLTDEELKNKTAEFKEILEQRPTSDDPLEDLELEQQALDAILPEAFATVREASKRVLGMRHFDSQLLGGIALHNNQIAEMRTGEGKTLVATLPAYLNALTGKGVHIITVNDYLAQRDMEKMGKVYKALGMTTGCIKSRDDIKSKKQAYNCDITYGTNAEFGFDYLRDNMALRAKDQVQRPFNFAIIDEADSILIDEAKTPLIINGRSDKPDELYKKMAKVVQKLEKDVDYEVDEKAKTVFLTEEGIEKSEELLGIDDLYDIDSQNVYHLTRALKAKELFKENRDYVVQNGEVIIVDESTGRLIKGRRWSDGIHQAVEAKEGVRVHSESHKLASTTFQNLYRLYPKLSGMTGTGITEKEEFKQIYQLDVKKMPPNKPDIRIDKPDEIYLTEKAKFNAVADEVAKAHETGRPILVGTTSIEKSEQLSELLKERGIEHTVLNAKQTAYEAKIVAQAGKLGAVTIATNMAGRGTDILLGGNPDFLAQEELAEKNITPENTADYDEILEKLTKEKKKQTDEEHKKVADLGGLYVIGTERHESRRVDNQLRGRAARQGDPGQTKFFLSLEDRVVKNYGGRDLDEVLAKLEKSGQDENSPIDNKIAGKVVERSQKRIEGQHYRVRKNVIKYDTTVNIQRQRFYKQRNEILQIKNLRRAVTKMIGKETERIVEAHLAGLKGNFSQEDLSSLLKEVQSEIPQLSTLKAEDFKGMTSDEIKTNIKSAAFAAYNEQEKKLVSIYNILAREQNPDMKPEAPFQDDNVMRSIERDLLLRIADTHWTEHLQNVEDLRSDVGIMSMGGKDPVREFQMKSFEMYDEMTDNIQKETVAMIFRA